MLRTIATPYRYEPKLDLIQTEIAIKLIKDFFEDTLASSLNLTRVSCPILLKEGKGINDNLNGTERIVSFEALDVQDTPLEIVQSLAKWKRVALTRYGFTSGEGLYTDMNAVRCDEVLDHIHSVYVDQWDWEKVILGEQRTLDMLKSEVRKIYAALKLTELHIHQHYSNLQPILPEDMTFVTTQELEDRYPELTPKQREDKIAEQYGAVFVMQIGGALNSGHIHDGRSPDYDDWTLNGDILFWYPELGRALEISSMGIRVNAESLEHQLVISNNHQRALLEFHQAILNDELPPTIGGGIGQSRLCMFLLKKAHIGEVQVSVWNDQIIKQCLEQNIPLL